MIAILLLIAFAAGFGFSRFGYAPLLGYLLTGFVTAAFGIGELRSIEPVTELGILLLLFTIGLKLDLKQLASVQVCGVALAHTVTAMIITAPVVLLIAVTVPSLELKGAAPMWALAFALTFSSTVFAVKIFDTRGENASFHAGITIGILIIQDLLAVLYLVFTSGEWPSPWALGLLALPLIKPLLHQLLRLTGHNELLILFGILMAVGGGALFEAVHLKAGLGALVAGILIGGSPRASELYKNLISFKDLFLIGFFLQIGYYGLPTFGMLIAAVLLAALVILRPLIYFLLFTATRLRARTSFLAAISLFSYSEFGLIVGSVAVANGALSSQWLTVIAIAMALSFFLSAPLYARANRIQRQYAERMQRFERPDRLPQEIIPSLGDAEVVVLGMGRVGLGVYEYLLDHQDKTVVGIDENIGKVQQLKAEGVNCVHGDASDDEFWNQTRLADREMLFLSLTNHRENLSVVRLAHERQFRGTIAVVSRFPDETRELEEMDCITFNLYAGAGHGFAEHVVTQIRERIEKKAEQI